MGLKKSFGWVFIAFLMVVFVHASNGWAQSSSFSTLYSFAGGTTDGATPQYGSLVTYGTYFYGMTSQGGANSAGTIFRINAGNQQKSILHSFGDPTVSTGDGTTPYGSLILSGSTLYGMTNQGGANGDGVIFTINTNGGGYAILYNFGSKANDGINPYGSLVLSGSTLYGMTYAGGAYTDPDYYPTGGGVIFKIGVNGKGYAILHSFGNPTDSFDDGANPYGSLVLSGSTLYGMTYRDVWDNQGVVFKINTNGKDYTALHKFGWVPNDGMYPYGSLVLAGSTLYGMTNQDVNGNGGVVFEINTSGDNYTILHNFGDGSVTNDGLNPYGSLTLLGGSLYGMTSGGGLYSKGTVFQINTDSTDAEILYHFGNSSITDDGITPYGDLMLTQSSDTITLYGMTSGGGGNGFGAIVTGTVGFQAPGSPTNVQAAPGNAQAMVSFSPPASDGGSGIISYTVTSSPGGKTDTGTGSPIIVKGLTNGKPYTFTVTATNEAGPGPASNPASNSVTPSATCLASLAGKWNINAFATGPDAPDMQRATLTISANGTISGSITEIPGKTKNVSAALWVFPYGMQIMAPDENSLCQVDANNTVFTCTETWSDGSTNLIIATKQAASCSLSNLAGNWNGNMLDSGPNSPTWDTISETITPQGAFTATVTPSGVSPFYPSGSMSISSSGVIKCYSSSDGCPAPNLEGFMNAGKTVAVGVGGGISTNGSVSDGLLLVSTKVASSSYSLADLDGSWGGNSLSTDGTWKRMSLIIGPDGSTSASDVSSDGSTGSGSVVLDISSVGGVTCDPSSSDCSNVNWVMDAGKTVMVGTETRDSGAAYAITILTKTVAAPGAATGVKATADTGQATVSFSAAPANGSPITGYTVTAIPALNSSGLVGTDSNGGMTSLTHTVTGLSDGIAYTFTVTATNTIGTGPASAASKSVTIK